MKGLITIFDRFAQQLGLAVGLKELGYNINFWCENKFLNKEKSEIIYSLFNRLESPKIEGDLSIWIESFSDLLQDAQKDNFIYNKQSDPYNFLLQFNDITLKNNTSETVIIDSSDSNILIDEKRIFGKNFFKREMPKNQENSNWKKFSFLHSVKILLEKPKKISNPIYDLTWAGSALPASRLNALLKIKNSKKDLTIKSLPFDEYLNFLNESKYALYLKGGGWMCYRMHEIAIANVPIIFEKPDIELHFDLNEIGIELNDYLNENYKEKIYDIQSWYENFYSPQACAKYLLNNI